MAIAFRGEALRNGTSNSRIIRHTSSDALDLLPVLHSHEHNVAAPFRTYGWSVAYYYDAQFATNALFAQSTPLLLQFAASRTLG